MRPVRCGVSPRVPLRGFGPWVVKSGDGELLVIGPDGDGEARRGRRPGRRRPAPPVEAAEAKLNFPGSLITGETSRLFCLPFWRGKWPVGFFFFLFLPHLRPLNFSNTCRCAPD